MPNGSYEMGFELGKHWAVRDASEEQLSQVRNLGDGRQWVASYPNPAIAFTQLVDPGKDDFLGTGAVPDAAFVAGFIDGAMAIKRE